MMLLGIRQCRGSPQVVSIRTDPWPKLGRLSHRKHLPDDDTSTDIWYIHRCDECLERPAITRCIKYPDYYLYYRREHGEHHAAKTLATNLAEAFGNNCRWSPSDDAISGGCFRADVRHEQGEGPYWWPSTLDKLEKGFIDHSGKKWALRKRTAITS